MTYNLQFDDNRQLVYDEDHVEIVNYYAAKIVREMPDCEKLLCTEEWQCNNQEEPQ